MTLGNRKTRDWFGATQPAGARESEHKEESIMRRAILCAILVIGSVGAVVAQTDEEVFPYSVASGDPRPTSVVLWTYLDSPLDVSPLELRLEVATDAEFATSRSTKATAAPSRCWSMGSSRTRSITTASSTRSG
jgi:phosphodiesterase/alkaline phosphatase D-like protein